MGKGVDRSKYPGVLDVLRYPSLKTPPKYELCPIDSGDECMRYDHTSNGKMFVGTSDEKIVLKVKESRVLTAVASLHMAGIRPCRFVGRMRQCQ